MLSAKQDSIKYHFLSLWYDSTWDWTQISRAIGEHSNHYANVRYVDFTDHGVNFKESEKKDKYPDLTRKNCGIWKWLLYQS